MTRNTEKFLPFLDLSKFSGKTLDHDAKDSRLSSNHLSLLQLYFKNTLNFLRNLNNCSSI